LSPVLPEVDIDQQQAVIGVGSLFGLLWVKGPGGVRPEFSQSGTLDQRVTKLHRKQTRLVLSSARRETADDLVKAFAEVVVEASDVFCSHVER
jgi:hypothetical protein